MRASLLSFVFIIAAPAAFAGTIAPSDAGSHVGQTVTVEAPVAEVFFDAKSGTTFLDMGGRYPSEAFTGVIFAESTGAFPDVQSLEGQTVDITGQVSLYKGRPEIILRDAGQLARR